MPLRSVDASSRAAHNLLDPERSVALFVADIAYPAAIWRKACLSTIELSEGQRQRRGPLHGRQPELLPLAAVITAEQYPPAIGSALWLRAPRPFFGAGFIHILGR